MTGIEELRSLEAFWRLKRGSRVLPGRSDFAPEDLRPWLGNLGLVSVERTATPDAGETMRFRVTLSGTQLDNYRGHSITGLYLDEIGRAIAATTPHYIDCVTRAVPVNFLHDNSANSAIYTAMSKLLLPLGEDGKTVDRIMVAIYPLRASNDLRLPGVFSLAG